MRNEMEGREKWEGNLFFILTPSRSPREWKRQIMDIGSSGAVADLPITRAGEAGRTFGLHFLCNRMRL